jgi:hydroxyacylglutathione hydrolase
MISSQCHNRVHVKALLKEFPMSLIVQTFVLGDLENNTYLAFDPVSNEAVLIDPAEGSASILPIILKYKLQLKYILLTHAHFDHIMGIKEILAEIKYPIPIGLHPDDLELWKQGGGAAYFGWSLDPGSDPDLSLSNGQKLPLGAYVIEVRSTPGHTPGHVIFYIVDQGIAFCGDLIFYRGVGRTDLPGGDEGSLLESIHQQVLSLPPQTRLLTGHGPETTVIGESKHNPFLMGRW